MRVNVLGDRVLILVDTAEDKTKSGLYIPEQGKDAPAMGTVIAVGPGRFTENGFFLRPACVEGDRIIFPKYAGATITIDGQDYLVIQDSDVICKTMEEDDEEPGIVAASGS